MLLLAGVIPELGRLFISDRVRDHIVCDDIRTLRGTLLSHWEGRPKLEVLRVSMSQR